MSTFEYFSGEVKSVPEQATAVCEEFRYREISRGPALPSGGGNYRPAFKDIEPVAGPRFVVINVDRPRAVGQQISTTGARVGTTNMGGGLVLPLWDCGLPYVKTVITSNLVYTPSEIAGQKQAVTDRVFANQLRNASNGYAYAQYELGKRYLAESNTALALHWLRSACTNGHTQASNALKQLGAR
jgi:hypothetical protein